VASFVKTKGGYRAQLNIRGQRPSKTFPTKLEAILWAQEQEAIILGSKSTIGRYTLSDAFDRYAKEVSPTKKGCQWELVRLEKLKRDPLAKTPTATLTNQNIQNWIDRQTLSAGSVLRELNLIQSVLKHCRRWRWTNLTPSDLRKPTQPRSRDRVISDSEVEHILKSFASVLTPCNCLNLPAPTSNQKSVQKPSKKQQVPIVFQIALETAMRKSEILGLQWEHCFMERRFIHLPDTKNGYPRDVPLSSKAIELLALMSPKESGRVFSISSESFDQLFRRARDKAGLSGFTFHDTRHTATTRLAKKFTMLELARITGHRDPRSLMVYFNESAEELATKLD